MRRPKVPHKPPAPSVRDIVSAAIESSRALSGEVPMTQQEVVRDMITKLDLPEPLKRQLRERHKLQ